MSSRDGWRRFTSAVMTGLCVAAVVVALIPLAMILFFVLTQGVQALTLSFFTELPKPVGESGGGMSNAILGTLVVCVLGALIAIPTGVMSGIYVAENPESRSAGLVR